MGAADGRVVLVRLDRPLRSGEVAKLCGVASRTVQKWADSGRLGSWRLPGCEDRRFELAELLRFMRASGMPIPPEIDAPALLSYGLAPGESVPGAIACPTLLEFGLALASRSVGAVVVGDADGRAAARGAIDAARSRHPDCLLVLVASADWRPDPDCPADHILRRPIDWAAVSAAVAGGRQR